MFTNSPFITRNLGCPSVTSNGNRAQTIEPADVSQVLSRRSGTINPGRGPTRCGAAGFRLVGAWICATRRQEMRGVKPMPADGELGHRSECYLPSATLAPPADAHLL